MKIKTGMESKKSELYPCKKRKARFRYKCKDFEQQK